MEEINVGEYIRTKKGYIDKIAIAENENNMYAGERNPEYLDYIRDDIVKHSPNIIDLIEVGDYVNGYKVTLKESTLLCTDIEGIDRSGYHIPISQYGEGITSIVTKEQFAAAEYRLED